MDKVFKHSQIFSPLHQIFMSEIFSEVHERPAGGEAEVGRYHGTSEAVSPHHCTPLIHCTTLSLLDQD